MQHLAKISGQIYYLNELQVIKRELRPCQGQSPDKPPFLVF